VRSNNNEYWPNWLRGAETAARNNNNEIRTDKKLEQFVECCVNLETQILANTSRGIAYQARNCRVQRVFSGSSLFVNDVEGYNAKGTGAAAAAARQHEQQKGE